MSEDDSMSPELLNEVIGVRDEMRRGMALLAEQLRPAAIAISSWQRQFQSAIGPALQEIAKAFRNLPEKNQRMARTLATYGWYIDPHSTPAEMMVAVELFHRGQIDTGHEYMCTRIEEQADSMRAALIATFPDRERLLTSAFKAHAREDYAASVPLFLAQADGICSSLTGEELYAKRDGRPKLAEVLSGLDEQFLITALLTPLLEPSPLSANKQERARMGPSADEILNRHLVLHGLSTTYDNRRNSCRAMSLIAYVAWVLGKRL